MIIITEIFIAILPRTGKEIMGEREEFMFLALSWRCIRERSCYDSLHFKNIVV